MPKTCSIPLLGLKRAREKAGLTQKVLAEKVNATVQYISILECGRATPSLELARDLADACGVDIPYLLHAPPPKSYSDRCASQAEQVLADANLPGAPAPKSQARTA